MFVGKRNTMFTEYTENIMFPCTFLEKSSFAFRLEKVSYISIFSRLYICMFVCVYIYIYIYIYIKKSLTIWRCEGKATSVSHPWNYWQIYFEISDFLISVVCKMKWKAYVQIIIITNKIQIYKIIK